MSNHSISLSQLYWPSVRSMWIPLNWPLSIQSLLLINESTNTFCCVIDAILRWFYVQPLRPNTLVKHSLTSIYLSPYRFTLYLRGVVGSVQTVRTTPYETFIWRKENSLLLLFLSLLLVVLYAMRWEHAYCTCLSSFGLPECSLRASMSAASNIGPGLFVDWSWRDDRAAFLSAFCLLICDGFDDRMRLAEATPFEC